MCKFKEIVQKKVHFRGGALDFEGGHLNLEEGGL